MKPTNSKLEAIRSAIENDIKTHQRAASIAMENIEKFNTSSDDFNSESLRFNINQFIAGYLSHIKSSVENVDLNRAETIIRYHFHTQSTKGQSAANPVILRGQEVIADILKSYVNRFFNVA